MQQKFGELNKMLKRSQNGFAEEQKTENNSEYDRGQERFFEWIQVEQHSPYCQIYSLH